MAKAAEFAEYCCELLSGLGPCSAKRMFGGWGLSTDGLTVAIVADLGNGETLWLKGDDSSRAQYDAAGCTRCTYESKGKLMGMNYFSAPADAMESPALMLPWARLALQAAQTAHASKKPATRRKLPQGRPNAG